MSAIRETLRRPEWSDMAPYHPVSQLSTPAAIDLSDNTSRFGAAPSALAVLAEPAGVAITRYPDAYSSSLQSALADHAGVAPSQVATGCGSDDVLDAAFRAFGRPGERLAHIDPTFPMAPRFARINGLVPIAVPLASDGSFDAGALLAGDPALVYLCSPNNPTGARLDPAAIERVIAKARGVVVLDEAYAEFAGASLITTAPRRSNLVVTRTLSKAFGLASLRVGYACAAEPLVREIELSRGPFKVTSLAERAATAALRNDVAWMRERVGEALALRARLADGLRSLGLSPLPSSANFVLVPVSGARRVAAAMRERGVAVRPFEALREIGDALRITVAPWAELEIALAALKEALRCA
jgi:histidinol-phosphate aminotransferase